MESLFLNANLDTNRHFVIEMGAVISSADTVGVQLKEGIIYESERLVEDF